ncbi:LysR family transcriptional regulator [Veronia pacifica]|uniref:HTH lysR-type domain-containing protein n=1 Tax=Veronia pacifica TaxID=1080227 RepID=A0A1C3EKJ6_9GAMM|nr:LysR family transcriptional regulator [Veronia pacifica]ODA33749.1 hypothetical protein A8L45_08930 [Veronia pacifica]
MKKGTLDHLEQLVVFTMLAKEQHFTRAGNRLGISKSQVSKQVRALEDRLGIPLVNRNTRSVSLTETGIQYAAHGIKILQLFDEAECSVQRFEQTETGNIDLYLDENVTLQQAMALTSPFQTQYPDVRFHFIRQTHRHEFDPIFHLAVLPSPPSSVKSLRLTRYPLRLVASKKYIDKNGRPKSHADLSQFNCIATQSRQASIQQGWRTSQHEKMKALFVEGNIKLENCEDVLIAVEQHCGIGYLPAHLVNEKIREGHLVSLLDELTNTSTSSLYLIYPDTQDIPNVCEAFINFLINQL